MSRTLIALLAVLFFSGCDQGKPEMSDEEMKRFREDASFLTDECLEKIRWGGIDAAKGDCTKRMPAARWRGLWRSDFEGSLFCPAPARECTDPRRSPRVWLVLEPEPASIRNARPGGLYSVDFIGRMSSNGTPYKASGYDQDIIVDRMISIKEVEPPPPPPKPAEELAGWRQCLADKTCFPTAEGKARIKELEAQVR